MRARDHRRRAAALGWFGAAVHVISPGHVRAIYQTAYDDYEALGATATNICDTKGQEDALPVGSPGWQAEENFRAGYVANYTRVAAHYDATMANIFEGAKVKPSDLPFSAPPLATALAAHGC